MGSKALRNAPGQSRIPQIGRFGLSRLLLSTSGIKSSKPIALLTLTLRCGLGHPKALGGPLGRGGSHGCGDQSVGRRLLAGTNW